MDKLDFIYKRHSVRKFKNDEVPNEDIKEILKAATYAPSGKNKQNWHFVVIKNKEMILKIAKIVENKNFELTEDLKDESMKNNFNKFVKYHTVFKNAPVLILIYCGPYPITGEAILSEIGAPEDEINDLRKISPGIQNIGATVENLLLAASNLGYGTCWMTGPMYANKEISEYVDFKKEGYFLSAMTPLGVPEESELKSPSRKPLEEVITFID